MSQEKFPYYLGCPAWSIHEWKGGFFPKEARPADFLNLYSKVFNTVEGNSTFYALPSLSTARRWATEVVDGFKFCFKVPRDLSHGQSLSANPEVLDRLLRLLQIVNDVGALGPTFLQLHGSFGPSRLDELAVFCERWPKEYPLAVEVRHLEFFAGGAAEGALHAMLKSKGMDRVIFDSRALYHAPPEDAAEVKSQGRKPRLPVKWQVVGAQPMLRFVGRNQIEKADPWLDETATVVANWIQEGKSPYVFMHTPDDRLAPSLCERFHQKLRARLPDVPPLEMKAARGPQMDLFSEF